jgi:hypothetical protein
MVGLLMHWKGFAGKSMWPATSITPDICRIFGLSDGGGAFLQNFGKRVPDYTASHSVRYYFL